MNVCGGFTTQVRGMPASLFNRACLDNCQNIMEMNQFISEHSPLGPYHLTAADPDSAQSVHFYQSDQETHVTRQWKDTQPITTLNCRYSPTSNCDMHHSTSRLKSLLTTLFPETHLCIQYQQIACFRACSISMIRLLEPLTNRQYR